MDKTTILDISGDIDLAHSPEVRKMVLVEFREKRTPRVILNLRDVNYIDSSGVASLVGKYLQSMVFRVVCPLPLGLLVTKNL